MMKIIVNTIVVNLKSTRVYQKLKNNPNFENPNCSIEVFTDGENGELIYLGRDFGKKIDYM